MARPPLAAALLLWWRCGLWTLCASTSATTFVPRPLRRESALALLQRLSLDGCKAILLFMGVCFVLSPAPFSLHVTPPPCPYLTGNSSFHGRLVSSLTRPIFPTCHTPTLPMSRQFILFKDTLSIDIGGTLAKVVLFQPRRGGEMPTEIRDLDAALDDGTLAVAPFAGEACPFFLKIGRAHQSVPICHTRILLNCSCVSHAHSPGIYQRVPSLTFSQRVTSQCTCRASELVS